MRGFITALALPKVHTNRTRSRHPCRWTREQPAPTIEIRPPTTTSTTITLCATNLVFADRFPCAVGRTQGQSSENSKHSKASRATGRWSDQRLLCLLSTQLFGTCLVLEFGSLVDGFIATVRAVVAGEGFGVDDTERFGTGNNYCVGLNDSIG